MSNKKALVVGGGEVPALPTLSEFVRQCDLVVGADLGAEHLLLAGRIPDAIIGDLDSCSAGVVERLRSAGCEIIEYPRDKNFTDVEAALDYCVEHGYKEILVAAALHGRRIDHIFGNVFLLPKYVREGVAVRLCDEGGRFIEAITDRITITGRKGTYVSIMPLTVRVTGVTTKGLKFPLRNKRLKQGSTLGLSNEMCEEEAEITIESGILLVIREKNR